MVKQKFKSLEHVNDPEFHLDEYQGSDFLIVRSNSLDDIHKAIKYGYWTFNAKNNERLEAIYKKNNKHHMSTILIFLLKNDNIIHGVA